MNKCAQKGIDATRLIGKVLALSAGAVIGASGPAYSGPEGGQVMGGAGHIRVPDAATTLIQQQSQNIAIDWQRFNVTSSERVLFQQPSASASVLNRILDQNPSQIFGSIEANGRVFLSNPNGIIFGTSATVNVGSLFATGLDMDAADFMSGRYEMGLADGESAGVVINRGLISAATGGSVTLVGGAVSNEGLIIADVGYVNLAAGRKAVVDFRGDGSIRFQVDEEVLENPAGFESAVNNSGEIRAEGGRVLLSGHAAQDVFSRVVNNDGVIRAGRIDDSGGIIRLVGTGGDVYNSGTLDASSGSGQGGDIDVLGDRVAITGEASIDASGATGGGNVRIGGDYQGTNPDVQNANHTYVGSDVVIKADATETGDGGKVIVWADGTTRFFGDISARGGKASGDGGFVETSGKQNLQFDGQVDTTAANGETGVLLLDPQDIIIVDKASTPGADDGQLPDLLFAEPGDGPPSATDWTIAENTLEDLNTNVILQANQDILIADLVDNNLNFTNIDTESVVMQAGRHITFAGATDVITTAGGAIHMEADSPHTGVAGAANGTGTLTLGGVVSGGGNITLIGAGFSLGGTINSSAGTINIGHSQSNDIQIGGGGAELAQAEITNLQTTGTLTIGQAVTKGTDGAGASSSTLTSDTVTVSGDITVASGSAGTLSLIANDGISINADLVTNQSVTINADTDANDHVGTLTVGNGDSLSTNGNSVAITADDIDFVHNDNSTIDAGASTVSITDSDGTGIGLGRATVTNGLELDADELDNITATGGTGITLTSTGGIKTDGTLTTVNTVSLNLASATTLVDDTTINTGGGDITFGNTLNATTAYTETLDLTAGAGNIDFDGIVGGSTALGAVTIISAANVVADAAFSAASLIQSSGTGLTTFTGAVNTIGSADTAGGVVNITTDGAITFGNGIDTSGGTAGADSAGQAGGAVTLHSDESGAISVTGAIDTSGSAGSDNTDDTSGESGGTGGAVIILADSGTVSVGAITTDGGAANGVGGDDEADGGAAGAVTITSTDNSTTLSGDISAIGGVGSGGGTQGAGGTVTFNSPVVLGGNRTITTGATAGNIIFDDILNATTAYTETLRLTAGTGNIDFNDTVGGVGVLGTLTLNQAATVDIDGTLNVAALTANGGNITTFDATGFNIITSGANEVSGGAVTITASGALTLADVTTDGGTDSGTDGGHAAGAVTLSGGDVTVGAISAVGSAAAGGGAAGGDGGTVTMTATGGTPTITLNDDIDTSGGAGDGGGVQGAGGTVTFNDAVTLGDNSAITTGTSAGDITFSTVDGAKTLGLTAGTGSVNLGAAGGATPLASLTISSAGQVDLANVSTTGTLAVTGSNIDLNGTSYISDDGDITFTGPVDLVGAGVSIDSDADDDTTDGDITFTSTVDGGQALVLDADSGAVSLGAAGGTTPLTSLTISNAGQADLANVATTGAQDVTADSINLNGTTYTIGTAGAFNFTGAVTLGENVVINQSGATDADDVIFTGSVAGDGNSLDINIATGLGDATFGGTVSGVNALTVDAQTSTFDAAATATTVTLNGISGADELSVTDTLTANGGALTIGNTNVIETIGFDANITGSTGIAVTGTSTVTVGSTVEVDGGTGSISMTDSTVNVGTNSIIFSSDGGVSWLALNSTGTGSLTLRPNAAGTALNIAGGTVGGSYNITDATLDGIDANFSSVTIGRATAGAVTMGNSSAIDLSLAGSNKSWPLEIIGGAGSTGMTVPTNSVTLNGQSLTLNIQGGDVTQAAQILDADLLLQGGAGFTLTHASNDFGTIAANTTGAVSIRDVDALEIGTVDGINGITSDTLSLQSGGAITDAAGVTMAVTDNAAFNGTSITLGDNGGDTVNFGSVTVNSAGAVAVSEDSGTVLSGVSTANSLDLNSTGTLADDGTADLTVTNNADLAGTAITLDDSYAFGTLTFNSAGAVSISETDATQVAGSNTGSSLSLSSGGALTNAAASTIAVTNNASLSGTSINLGAAAGDTVNFGSVTANSVGTVTIMENSATDFAGTSSVNTLVVNANGDVTDSGEINVTGTASFTVSNGSNISLDTASNTFGSTVTLAASTGTINDGTLVGDTTLALGALTVTGDLDVTANGTLAIDGAVTSTGGDIRLVGTGNVTQSANITAAGSAKVFSDTGTITMGSHTVTRAGTNDNGRAIVYTASGDVTIAVLEATATGLTVEVTSQTGAVMGTLEDANITGLNDTTANIHAIAVNQDIGSSLLPLRFKNSALSAINYGLNGGTLYHSGEGGSQLAIPPITLAEHPGLFSYESSGGLNNVVLSGGSIVDVPGLILSGTSGAAAAAESAFQNVDSSLLKKRTKIYNIVGQGVLLPKHQLDEEEGDELELEDEEGGLTHLFQVLPLMPEQRPMW
ncbi:MAG: filamentous hemagglutinin N-terminal domain-containing protein [Sedimenticola sp.]